LIHIQRVAIPGTSINRVLLHEHEDNDADKRISISRLDIDIGFFL